MLSAGLGSTMRRLLGALALCVASAKMHDHGPQLEEHEMPVVIVEALDHLIKSSVNTTLPDSLGLHHLPWAPVGSNTSMGDPVAWETKGASADHLVTLDEAGGVRQNQLEVTQPLVLAIGHRRTPRRSAGCNDHRGASAACSQRMHFDRRGDT